MGVVYRLYHGETAFPLIRQRKRFYAASLVLVVIGLLSMSIRWFNLGVEFKGGAIFTVNAPAHVSVKDTRDFVAGLGAKDPIVQTLKSSTGQTRVRVETEPLTEAQTNAI